MKHRYTIMLVCLALLIGFALPLQAAEPPKDPILRLDPGMHTAMIWRMSIDAEGRLLATASDDKTVRLWEYENSQLRLLRVLRPPLGEGDEGKMYAVAISPDGTTVAASGWTQFNNGSTTTAKDGHNIYFLNTRTGGLTGRITGLPVAILHLSFSPDGQFLAVSLGYSGIRIFRVTDIAEVGRDVDYGNRSNGHIFFPSTNGTLKLATTSYDGNVRLYDVATKGSLTLRVKVKAPGGSQPFGIAASRTGRLAVGYNDSTKVDVLSGDDLALLFSADTSGIKGGNLCTIAWSSDGNTLYAGGRYGNKPPVISWANSGRGLRQEIQTGASSTIATLIPLPKGSLLVGTVDPAIALIDGQKGQLLKSPETADFRDMLKVFQVSRSGDRVRFGYQFGGKTPSVFDISNRTLLPGDNASGLQSPVTSGEMQITDWEFSNNPKLNGTPLKLGEYERSRSLAIAPQGAWFALGTNWYLRTFNRDGTERWKVPAPSIVWAVNVTGDGSCVVAAFGDGTIRWYRATNGRELLAFYPHPDKKRWVLWTPEGFFDAAKDSAALIGYHLNQGKDKEAQFVGIDKFYDQFYRPDLVQAKFQGKDLSEYAKAVDVKRLLTTETFPPVVRLTTASGTSQKRDTEIKGEVCEKGGGIGDVTLYLNDMPIVVDTGGRSLNIVAKGAGGQSCREFSHTITLTEEENLIGLMARNKANTIESNRASVTLTYSSGSKERPDLYILAVAVNKYRDGDLRLKYPIPDADDLARSILDGGKRLFGKVIVKTVYDDEATRAGLERAFQEMGGKTRRDDVFVLFLAGHGITYEKDGNYYFLPVDFRYTSEEAIQKQGVSKDDLMKNLTHIQAMKSLLLLDTCNSGSFAEAVASRNIVEKTAVARLSKATGRSTIVASSRDQAALEGYEGHGVFTYAILQGINGGAKDKEGKVTVNGLATFVEETLPKLTFKKWGYEQIPQKSLQGMDFPLVLH